MRGERTSADCVAYAGISQPRVSVHLSCLVDCGYVNARRDGRKLRYSVRPARGRPHRAGPLPGRGQLRRPDRLYPHPRKPGVTARNNPRQARHRRPSAATRKPPAPARWRPESAPLSW
ncbi:helix-turn-helix domain-containing protein [Streptomyces sp. INA 01156]